MTEPERQAVVDEEHLRLLSLFHYVSGGLTLAFSLFFGVGILFMAAMFSAMPHAPAGATAREFHGPPVLLFWILGFFFLLGIAYGVLELVSARSISQRVRRVFTLIVAVPGLIFIPYGTILSILTLLVLERPSVKQLYRQ